MVYKTLFKVFFMIICTAAVLFGAITVGLTASGPSNEPPSTGQGKWSAVCCCMPKTCGSDFCIGEGKLVCCK